MTETTAEARTGRVEFTGGRQEMLGIILRGYALMIPTIGLYRFWQATWKRRFQVACQKRYSPRVGSINA